jgi:deoxycytidine triphosphate deaminase/addiction module HigA family antidote
MAASNRGRLETGGDLSPGEHLRREIERLDLDQVAVSKATRVSRQTINNIVNDRQPISRAMSAKLARLMGHSSDYWLRKSYPRQGGNRDQAASSFARKNGVLVNHQIVRAVKDGVLGIEPFTAANVRMAAIDLTLGDAVLTSDGETANVGGRKAFFLKPGRAVQARTRERIGFPNDYVGRVGVMHRMGTFGIIASLGFQIEPGFDGHVHFCMFNAGGAPFRLRGGEPVLRLEITALSARPMPASG